MKMVQLYMFNTDIYMYSCHLAINLIVNNESH